MEVKDIIKSRRLELGMTMKELAKAVGVSEATISRWESGDIENMRRDKIAALAKALQLKPETIMEWEVEKDRVEYYLDPETARFAQAYFDDPMTRALFDAKQGASAEDVQMAIDLLNRLKRTNPDG